jgi:hypothetical protein
VIQIEDLSKNIKNLRKNKKKIVFTIGSTSKLGSYSSYFTPIRETRNFIILGVNFYNKNDVKKVINTIHKYVDYVFIDCEKKIQNSLNFDQIINYFKFLDKKNFFKKKFFIYKANDLTVEAAYNFLLKKFFNYYEINDHVFGILGVGNIGTKLALKINETGGKVLIFRRNLGKLKVITNALNIIKSKYSKNNFIFSKSVLEIYKKSDILISCSNAKKPIITKQLLKNYSNLSLILDIGKQSISSDGIIFAHKNSIKIFRLDISTSLVSMIENQIKYHDLILKRIGRKKIKNNFVVSGGYIGMRNDLIVDDVNNIKKIYGIADGKGDFKKRFGNISLKRYFSKKTK